MSQECSPHDILKDRAAMFHAVRSFFEKKGVLEVDTPILSKTAPIDAHINILKTEVLDNQSGFLHSSAEYGMKKLLALGAGDIYQLCHVFRQGELSHLHQIEFTMLEWYRHQFTFDQLVLETKELIELFLGIKPSEHLRYDEILRSHFGIDPFQASIETLHTLCEKNGFICTQKDKETYLHFLWDLAEKRLGDEKLTFVTHFPAWQAALSHVFEEQGILYAARFECYYQGIELANGYHELTDPCEQKKRLLLENAKRGALGKESLPLDEEFLEALGYLKNLTFHGVAVGFDRLMMLRHKATHIEDVIALGWTQGMQGKITAFC